MIQKNHGHRPDNRVHTNPHAPMHERADAKQCDCGSDCKCGCQEGKPCTCGSGCAAASGIANGIFGLISACLICGSVLYVGDQIKKSMPVMPTPPRHVVDAKTVNRAQAALEGIANANTAIAEYAKNNAQGVPAEALNNAIAEYIKNNPQAILDSVNAYQEKQQRQRPQPPKVADSAMLSEILGDKTNHVLGNPKGTFVMIEFFDYNCGYCKMMNKKMAEAIKKSDNIRWVVMDAPIFGERSEIISQYAYAAGKQGKYAEYHAALGEENDKSEEKLKEIGKKLKLDVAKLEKDAKSDAAKEHLKKIRTYTQKLNLGGVPMFIIDGQIVPGAFSDEQMEEYIKKAEEMKPAKKKK